MFLNKEEDIESVLILTQLQGIPLKIRLKGVRDKVFTSTFVEIAAEIERGLDFLESSMQDVPDRQRSMWAVFDYSWKMMSSREQATFPKLSVLRGRFSREAAKRIVGITARDLIGLVSKSLIQHSPNGRFDLHPLLQQYATKILIEQDFCHKVRDAYCAYFAAVLQDLGESMIGRRQQQALTVLDADFDNAWAAWEWAVEHSLIEQIDQALVGLAIFLTRQLRFDEGLHVICATEQVLDTP